MRTPATSPGRVRQFQPATFPTPTAGWISNRSLASPQTQGGAAGATVLDNFFPSATSVVLRRGSIQYAVVGEMSEPVVSLFTFMLGDQEKLFAATDAAIYDISLPVPPDTLVTSDGDTLVTDAGDVLIATGSSGAPVMDGFTSGDWSVVQFATAGGTFLFGVDGSDDGFVYDGETFLPIVAGGITVLAYDGGTSAFLDGETVTGGTSGATGTIWRVHISPTPGIGTLYLTGVTGGPFQDGEALTSSGPGTGIVNGAPYTAPGTNITFPSGVALTTADLNYVWVYKERLWFIQKGSLDAWYLPVDQLGGELTWLPLGGIFDLGGYLVFGQNWSLGFGASGGLSEQNVFVTSEGEVAVFQGDNPDSADSWAKVGVYRIGNPLGSKAFIRAGGDLIIATTIGFIPLSQAIDRDVTALVASAVSFPIEVAWNEAVQTLQGDWAAKLWPEGQMVAIAIPRSDTGEEVMFVANARTGAWARFTGWYGRCLVTFRGSLFFGTDNGRVIEAMVGGQDEGAAYTGVCVPLFDDLGSPASLKAARMSLPMMRASSPLNVRVSCQYDFGINLPPPPAAPSVSGENAWGVATWGDAVWGSSQPEFITKQRVSLTGIGYRLAPALQVTSGSVVPLDARIVSMEVTYELADQFT